MGEQHDKLISAIFITFSGNCKKALLFYQTCFGGRVQFKTFGKELQDYKELPVVSGALFSNRVIIYGSDLVHNEGRKTGNFLSIYLHCESVDERRCLMNKLESVKRGFLPGNDEEQQLIEVIDAFDVRWILGV